MTILKDLSLENNLWVGTALDDVCNLREMELQLFVTDCPDPSGEHGVTCDIGDCCTFCRRNDNSGR
jgi:hypothetical protein